jgi:flagellar basal-body rod protein FlgF
MIRGLYTSGWSMMAIEKKMDVISNNLANVNTVGYKKDDVVLESFPEELTRRIKDTHSVLNPTGIIGNMEQGFDVGEIFTYYSEGKFLKTGNDLNLAIKDSEEAFFTVAVPDEDGNYMECCTRDGSFLLNSEGVLVTREGYEVIGVNGPIVLNGERFMIENDGTVLQGNNIIGSLLIKQFDNVSTLRKFKENLVVETAETNEIEFNGKVIQGYLEQSNVNTINEMVDIITVMRAYEANQKCLQIQDSTLEKVVNEVGVVR